MKQETLDTFVAAKQLFMVAEEMCQVDQRHVASCGLIVLQDSIELVVHGCLVEKGVDEQKGLEKASVVSHK